MEFNEFQVACLRTQNPELTTRDAQMNWALGIAGESGEYCELIKKHYFHGKELDQDAVKKELGDILYYVASAAHVNGLRLEDVAKANEEKLRGRYPEGFKKGGGNR